MSKEIIVATALDIIKKDGLAGFSMRKVAGSLDTGPASLYVYVANLNVLNGCVLDLALGEVVLPSDKEGHWKARLFDLLQSYQAILYQSPGLAELAQTTIPLGPHALRIMEAILEILVEAGLEPGIAAWGVDLLLLYVTSVAYEQNTRQKNGFSTDPITNVFNALDPVQFPHIFSLRHALLSGGEARFKWGFETIMHGIMHGIMHTPNEPLHS